MARKKITTTTVTTVTEEIVENVKQRAYVYVILDKSGSMETGRDVTIRGYNEQIQTIKSTVSPEIDTKVSLVTFNNEVECKFWNENVNQFTELTRETYRPNSMTALYDAVGYVLDRCKENEGINDANTSVLVIILSDGEENASRKWSSASIAERVQELEKTGRWTFTYMGSNVNLNVVSQNLGINISNMASFDSSTSKGYLNASDITAGSIGTYFSARNGGAMASAGFYDSSNNVLKQQDADATIATIIDGTTTSSTGPQ